MHQYTVKLVENHRHVSASSQRADQADTSLASQHRQSTAELRRAATAADTSPANQHMLPLT